MGKPSRNGEMSSITFAKFCLEVESERDIFLAVSGRGVAVGVAS